MTDGSEVEGTSKRRTSMLRLTLLALIAFPLGALFFLAFAMSGGSDCAVPPKECARVSAAFGFAALLFLLIGFFSIWKLFKLGRM